MECPECHLKMAHKMDCSQRPSRIGHRTSSEDARIQAAISRLVNQGISQNALDAMTEILESAERERDSLLEQQMQTQAAIQELRFLTQRAFETRDPYGDYVWVVLEPELDAILVKYGLA